MSKVNVQPQAILCYFATEVSPPCARLWKPYKFREKTPKEHSIFSTEQNDVINEPKLLLSKRYEGITIFKLKWVFFLLKNERMSDTTEYTFQSITLKLAKSYKNLN